MGHEWIHGDALIEMYRQPPVDLVIADPPYDDQGAINKGIRIARPKCKGPMFWFMYAENLLNLSWENHPDQILFWAKAPSTKNTKRKYSRFVEVICAYDLELSPFNQDTHWTTRSGIFTDQLTYREHEFQKPISLIEKLLAVNSREGDVVLDPFAGSGTVRKACENMNRSSISIEIERMR